MDEDFRRAALDYHRLPRPGKLAVEPTKRMATQRDLALAYSPGVAAACEAIAADPDAAWDYTTRGNLVAVVSNGTAVLGLGAIGAAVLGGLADTYGIDKIMEWTALLPLIFPILFLLPGDRKLRQWYESN